MTDHNKDEGRQQYADTHHECALTEIERLQKDVVHWREARRTCLEAGDMLEEELDKLRSRIAELEAWQEEGKKLFDNYSTGLSAMFGLGKWWGERPWKPT